MRNRTRYAAIGYVTSKFVLPLAKRQAKRAARRKAKGMVTSTTKAVTSHPARTSIVVGSIVGAAGWLLARGRAADEVASDED